MMKCLSETAMLLPGKYAATHGGRGYDVRSNLRSFRRKEDHFRYCAVFRVERATGVCGKDEDTQELRKGEMFQSRTTFSDISCKS